MNPDMSAFKKYITLTSSKTYVAVSFQSNILQEAVSFFFSSFFYMSLECAESHKAGNCICVVNVLSCS